jgi:hypothetical protein
MKPMPDSIEELTKDPAAYGIPTFEEFVKNKRKYLGSREDTLESVDRGCHATRLKHRYFVEGYRVDSLEQAERIALDMGFDLYENFILDPQIVQNGNDGLINEVRFRSKESIARRSKW